MRLLLLLACVSVAVGCAYLPVETAVPDSELRIFAVDKAGQPVEGLDCVAVPDLAGAVVGDIGYSTNTAGLCVIPVRATGFTVLLKARLGANLSTVGSGRVDVRANDVAVLKIVVSLP